MNKKYTLLGGLSVKQFLSEYWQKKPLLIRNAIPNFSGLLDPQQLISLACMPDAQARLVVQKNNKWLLYQNEFSPNDFTILGKSKWTILVQGVNHTLPQAAKLLQQFNFIPHSRLDDLMVSYAPKNGGVGPHFDSYDVFLLQGSGHRRWQISSQQDHTLVENAPIRILQNFKAEQEWVLEPGDMLYLPPHWAHNGIAIDDCMTYSIGFRAPSQQELGEQFMVYMQDSLALEGMYSDDDLKPQSHPSEISEDMLQKVINIISQVKWKKEDVANFLGCYLSEPKSHLFFDPPDKPMTLGRFEITLRKSGVLLDLKTLFLCYNERVFINGEVHLVEPDSYKCLRELADKRFLDMNTDLNKVTLNLLYQWYKDGYLMPGIG